MSSEAAIEVKRTTQPTSISLELPLHDAAKEKARRNRQSFSAYVATLIERDLGICFSEPVAEPVAEPEEVGS